MNDYIVNKKYRLLELHPEDSYKWEGLEYKVGVIEEIDKYGIGFRFLDGDYKTLDRADGYPKMELVEEEPVNMLMDYKTIPEFKHRTHKKHYLFKNREYKHGR